MQKNIDRKVVNLSLDGWSHPVIYACDTTENGLVYLTKTTDITGNAHTAEYRKKIAVNDIRN